MSREAPWCKESWEASVSSRAWGATPYDEGWDHCAAIVSSPDLRGIWEEEMALGQVPPWAREIMQRMISLLPICGHYAFPLPIVQVCAAIGQQRAPAFVYGCYTADAKRKRLLSYYVYCLDAWLQDAPLEVAQAELAWRSSLGRAWPAIVETIYAVLGPPSPQRVLLISRLVHRLRWWIKTLIWPDDHRDRFQLDTYAGDVRGDEARWGAYGNSPYGDPYFAERSMPQMAQLARRITDEVPDGKALLELIEGTWLCAPKVFRNLEKLILRIGAVGTGQGVEDRSILQCEDTYPDVASQARWYSAFMRSLSGWLAGDAAALHLLGEVTPTKHWLARILEHKLRTYAQCNNLGNLVGARPTGRRGTQTIGPWTNSRSEPMAPDW